MSTFTASLVVLKLDQWIAEKTLKGKEFWDDHKHMVGKRTVRANMERKETKIPSSMIMGILPVWWEIENLYWKKKCQSLKYNCPYFNI